MKRTTGMTLALVALAVTAVPASAQQRVTWMGRLGGDYGGEKVLEFQYEDGSTPDVTAGGGLLLTAGANIQLMGDMVRGLDARLATGIKYRTIPPATNQEATWMRIPLEATLHFRTPARVTIGGGVVYHLRNVLEVTGDAASGRVEFQNTPGFIVQGEYRWTQIALDLRYTAMTYKTDGTNSESVGASSFGGGISYYFGR
jgi:hypothetical protein